MFNRLSSFAKYLIFFASFFAGAFFDGLINESTILFDPYFHSVFIYIWAVPLLIFLLFFVIHKFKIYSKLALFLLPILLGFFGGYIIYIPYFIPFFPKIIRFFFLSPMMGPLLPLISGPIGAGAGIVFGLLFLRFFDKNIIETEIKHKWMLITSIASPVVFYCIEDVYNLMAFYPIENIALIILNLFGILSGLLFLILNRTADKAWKWRVTAIFGLLFSAIMFEGGLTAYRNNKLLNQIPSCTDSIKTECLNRSEKYMFKN